MSPAVGGTLVTSFGGYGVNAMRVLEAGPTRVVWESIAPDGTTPTGHTPAGGSGSGSSALRPVIRRRVLIAETGP
jgi:hypothetical protein